MASDPATLPFVSIVLPVRNEGKRFEETLDRVLAQDYPASLMEVLVVDGLSDDATPEVVRAVAARDARVRLLANPGRIVPPAMNIGIRSAKGDVVVRIDGHTRIAADYVRRCVEALRASGASCAGGRMDTVGRTFVGRLVAAATSGRFGVGDSAFHYADTPRFTETVYMGAWPREALVRVGGFDEEMVRDQDDELNYRIRKQGGTVWLDPSIRSEYTPRGSFVKLWKQYYEYGYWKVRVFQKHPSMMRWRHFVPAAFVASGIAAVAMLAFPWAPWVLAAGAALYAAAAAVAAAVAHASLVEKLALPSVYFTIHSAYGAGFLVGLVRFLPRWFHDRPWRGLQAALPQTGFEENER